MEIHGQILYLFTDVNETSPRVDVKVSAQYLYE